MSLDVDAIKRISDENGHCDHCGRVIKIYNYQANKALATLLKAMAARYYDTLENKIDISSLPLPYEILTQRTKLRLHGLIAQAKDEDGVKMANKWLITRKGWDWVDGDPIPEKVVVFDNQVLGHAGGNITIDEALHGKLVRSDEYEELMVNTPTAKVLHDVRTPNATRSMIAKFVGHDYTGQFKKGQLHNIEVGKLQTGKAVVIAVEGRDLVYKDIAKFHEDWRIVTEG